MHAEKHFDVSNDCGWNFAAEKSIEDVQLILSENRCRDFVDLVEKCICEYISMITTIYSINVEEFSLVLTYTYGNYILSGIEEFVRPSRAECQLPYHERRGQGRRRKNQYPCGVKAHAESESPYRTIMLASCHTRQPSYILNIPSIYPLFRSKSLALACPSVV